MFFLKQKTAYEMRISDWSSDVCSSDLRLRHPGLPARPVAALPEDRRRAGRGWRSSRPAAAPASRAPAARRARAAAIRRPGCPVRSEEHTSELQSLMRISYAVFCLKKKNKTNTKTHKIQQ